MGPRVGPGLVEARLFLLRAQGPNPPASAGHPPLPSQLPATPRAAPRPALPLFHPPPPAARVPARRRPRGAPPAPLPGAAGRTARAYAGGDRGGVGGMAGGAAGGAQRDRRADGRGIVGGGGGEEGHGVSAAQGGGLGGRGRAAHGPQVRDDAALLREPALGALPTARVRRRRRDRRDRVRDRARRRGGRVRRPAGRARQRLPVALPRRGRVPPPLEGLGPRLPPPPRRLAPHVPPAPRPQDRPPSPLLPPRAAPLVPPRAPAPLLARPRAARVAVRHATDRRGLADAPGRHAGGVDVVEPRVGGGGQVGPQELGRDACGSGGGGGVRLQGRGAPRGAGLVRRRRGPAPPRGGVGRHRLLAHHLALPPRPRGRGSAEGGAGRDRGVALGRGEVARRGAEGGLGEPDGVAFRGGGAGGFGGRRGEALCAPDQGVPPHGPRQALADLPRVRVLPRRPAARDHGRPADRLPPAPRARAHGQPGRLGGAVPRRRQRVRRAERGGGWGRGGRVEGQGGARAVRAERERAAVRGAGKEDQQAQGPRGQGADVEEGDRCLILDASNASWRPQGED